MKRRFMKAIKKYLEACVTGDIRDRDFYLGWLQGVASAELWNGDIELYEYYNSEIVNAISLSSVVFIEAHKKF